ncbi:uncharacterized protein LOC132738145 [Ruditapes philippinarum]|uniref:uncharacterized protein LOC132738145 n=1 Tax=Ruditapes philippinarum TaxID=129788 RepID=UPI00295A67C6|nr:uncharacterized protein LOC132738145 [Ruditapes philippinarum]
MSISYRCLFIQSLILCFSIVQVYSSCKQRCKLGLERIGYQTCPFGTGCKESKSGVDRCYETLPATKVPYSVLKESTITVSSTLTYGGVTNVKENIFSADISEIRYPCFHSLSEEFPFVEVQLTKPIVVDSMYLRGRFDGQMFQVPKNLKNLEIAFNGIKLPQSAYSFDASKNIVAVKGSQLEVKNVKITRPKPPNVPEWFITICDMEIYASGGFT